MDNGHKAIREIAKYLKLDLTPMDYGYLALFLSIYTYESACKSYVAIEESIQI